MSAKKLSVRKSEKQIYRLVDESFYAEVISISDFSELIYDRATLKNYSSFRVCHPMSLLAPLLKFQNSICKAVNSKQKNTI